MSFILYIYIYFLVINYIMSSLQNSNIRIPRSSWKGNNPVGVTSTHIRPLTNNDPNNFFPTGFGLPRPLKHYRRGTMIPIILNPENSQLEYNINRAVKTTTQNVISQLIDKPGSFIVKNDNNLNDCKNCQGVGIVSGWYPINNLTENPEPNVTNKVLCCNQEKKALKRVLPASTLVKKNYYQTNNMYLYNRCQTFQQRQFNFVSGTIDENIFNIIKQHPFVSLKILEYAKPGSPLSLVYLYVAQCNPNSTIDKSIILYFINNVLESLLLQNIITEEEEQMIKQSNVQTISEFISILKNVTQNENALTYLYNIASLPYYENVLTSTNKNCKRVYYKPNNPQFATQGGVSSSTRLLKLNVDTISRNASSLKEQNLGKQKGGIQCISQRQNKNICF
jgi:hypothetical protein